jgi:DNA-binding NarL/FixJ family response regulator
MLRKAHRKMVQLHYFVTFSTKTQIVTCAMVGHELPSTKLARLLCYYHSTRYFQPLAMLPSLLLIEDQLFLITLLVPKLQSQFQVTAVSTPAAALAQLQTGHFAVALLDLKLDNSNVLHGLNLLPALKASGTPVIVVSAHCTGAAPALCLRGGVSGFVDKIHTANGLLPVIETVLAGNKSLPTEWGSTSPAKVFKLNTSQRRVLERILANPYERNQSIAKKISLSLSTVKKNVSLLLRFFDCETRFELAHEAERCGFLPEITQAKRR